MINATEKKNACILILYGMVTVQDAPIVRKLVQFPALVVFFTAFDMAENGYKRKLLIFSISAQKYSDFPKIWKFLVLVSQFLPFHCSF